MRRFIESYQDYDAEVSTPRGGGTYHTPGGPLSSGSSSTQPSAKGNEHPKQKVVINYADHVKDSGRMSGDGALPDDLDDEAMQRTASNLSVGYNHYEPTSPMRHRSSNNIEPGHMPEWPISHAKKADPMF